MGETLLGQLAAFTIESTFDALPEAVQHPGRRALVNWVGSVFGGANTDTVNAAIKGAQALGSQGSALLFARREHLGMPDAALINCMGGQSQSFDDTDLRTLAHPTGPAAAAVFATASTRKVTGREAIHAILLGMELQCRVSLAIVRGGTHPGWYMTGLTGGIGAAAAVGKLLGLDQPSMTSALPLAVAQACGTRATHGSMAAALVPALGARNGLNSAFMAASGFTCSAWALDGKNSLLQVLGATGSEAVACDRLGSHYEVLMNTYKPFPTAIVIQPAIDACLRLKRRLGFGTAQVASLDLQVHPRGIDLGGLKSPRDYVEAQTSMLHWVTIALAHGQASVEHEAPGSSETAPLRALKTRITMKADDSLAPDQACATLRTTGGAVHVAQVEHAVGSQLNPMTDEQLREKFFSLCGRILSPHGTERLWDQCWNIDGLADAAALPLAASLQQS